MGQHIDAIFENGVFKPLQPLSLPDQTRVKVTVEDAAPQQSDQPKTTDAMGYPSGYFEATAGSFANEPLERPSDLPWDSRESW